MRALRDHQGDGRGGGVSFEIHSCDDVVLSHEGGPRNTKDVTICSIDEEGLRKGRRDREEVVVVRVHGVVGEGDVDLSDEEGRVETKWRNRDAIEVPCQQTHLANDVLVLVEPCHPRPVELKVEVLVGLVVVGNRETTLRDTTEESCSWDIVQSCVSAIHVDAPDAP